MAVRRATAPGASVEPIAGLLVLERSPGLFSVYGEIDAAAAPRISELGDVHGALQFDLFGVTFMDSGGIAALVRLHQRCERDGCTFRIVERSPQVERLLQIVSTCTSASHRPAAAGRPTRGLRHPRWSRKAAGGNQ